MGQIARRYRKNKWHDTKLGLAMTVVVWWSLVGVLLSFVVFVIGRLP